MATGQSNLVECPECHGMYRARGLQSHIAFKHPSLQLPLLYEGRDTTPSRIEPTLTELEDRATPCREATETTRAPIGAGDDRKTELETRLPERLPARSELAEKRQGGGGWLLLAGLLAAIWVSRRTPSDAIETLQERERKPIMGERH